VGIDDQTGTDVTVVAVEPVDQARGKGEDNEVVPSNFIPLWVSKVVASASQQSPVLRRHSGTLFRYWKLCSRWMVSYQKPTVWSHRGT
jgi:hypothetical protein